jgi:hypothetical protein
VPCRIVEGRSGGSAPCPRPRLAYHLQTRPARGWQCSGPGIRQLWGDRK